MTHNVAGYCDASAFIGLLVSLLPTKQDSMNAVTLDWSCVVLLNNVKSFKILFARPEIIFTTKSCHILQSQEDVKFIKNKLKSNLKCLSKEADFVANWIEERHRNAMLRAIWNGATCVKKYFVVFHRVSEVTSGQPPVVLSQNPATPLWLWINQWMVVIVYLKWSIYSFVLYNDQIVLYSFSYIYLFVPIVFIPHFLSTVLINLCSLLGFIEIYLRKLGNAMVDTSMFQSTNPLWNI